MISRSRMFYDMAWTFSVTRLHKAQQATSSIKPVLALRDSLPRTVNEVRKLMGFLNYYRRYVKHFSRIAKPSYDLMKTPSQSLKDIQ